MMDRARAEFAKRVGRRGAPLLIIAAAYVGFGIGILQGLDPQGPAMWLKLIPNEVRAGLWFTSAGVVFVGAFVTRSRWFYGVAMIMPALRVTLYFWAWVMWVHPSHPVGFEAGWYFATWHALLLLAIWYVSGIRESADRAVSG